MLNEQRLRMRLIQPQQRIKWPFQPAIGYLQYGMRHTKSARFQPVATLRGRLEWSCPYCGFIQHQRVNPMQMRLTCKGENCRAIFEVSIALRPPCLKRGKDRPRDTIMELAPLPLALLLPRRLSKSQCVHVVLDVAGSVVVGAGAPLPQPVAP